METPSLRKHVIFSRKFGHFGFCSWFGIAGSEQAFPVPLGLPMTIIVEMLQLFIFFRPCFEFPSVYSKILWFPLFLISLLFNVSKFWEYEVQVNDYYHYYYYQYHHYFQRQPKMWRQSWIWGKPPEEQTKSNLPNQTYLRTYKTKKSKSTKTKHQNLIHNKAKLAKSKQGSRSN